MGFQAEGAVEPLDYDFTAFGGPSGTIPDPPQQVLNEYFRTIRALGLGSADEITKTYDAVGDDLNARAELDNAAMAAVVKLCGGELTRDDLDLLPSRVQRAFYGWLFGLLLDPTPGTHGTRRSPAARTNGALVSS